MTDSPGPGKLDEIAARLARLWKDGSGPRLWVDVYARLPNAAAGLDRFLRAPDDHAFLDHAAEMRWALVLSALGFAIEIEPLGPKGPDLGLGLGGFSGFGEVTRLRPMNPGPGMIGKDEDGEDVVLPYGDTERDTNKALGKLLAKERQLIENRPNLVLIRNDDDALDEGEVVTAFNGIVENRGAVPLTLRRRLSGVAYDSVWCGPTGSIHVWSNPHAGFELPQPWIQRLRRCASSDCLRRIALGEMIARGELDA